MTGLEVPNQGDHLARLIKEAGLDNTKLGRLSGVPRETISRIVNDHQGIGDDVARKLAPHLGVSADEVVLPKEQEVESRRGFDLRLQQLEAEVDLWKALLLEALALLGLQVTPEADPGARVQRRPPRQRPASGGQR